MPDDVKALTDRLAAPFDQSEVKWKPQMVKGNKALAMPFIDARCVQDRLDEVLGVEGWTEAYELLPDGSVTCRLSCRLGGEWVTKQDVGSPSEQPDGGDRLKAAYSDALKRAAVKFGVGRHLYRLKAQWCDYDPVKRQFVRVPTLPAAQPAPAARPQQGTATAVRPANGAAPKPANGSALPADGAELARRLDAYDARLAREGVCAAGDLVRHVARAGRAKGYGDDLARWAGPAIAFAVEETRAFEAARRGPGARADEATLFRIDDLLRKKGKTWLAALTHFRVEIPEAWQEPADDAEVRAMGAWLQVADAVKVLNLLAPPAAAAAGR